MKKKLVFGLSAACIAGAFWACGDGEIINADASLEGLAEEVVIGLGLGEGDIKNALANCVAGAPGYEGCQEEMANPPDIIETSSETPASSADQTPGTSASQVPRSSSSILRQTSSTGPIGQLSSSSQAPTPVSQIVEVSSSSAQPSTGDTNYGTCAPKVSTIELNTSTTWTFSKGAAITNPMDMMSAKLEWTFEGGSIPSYTVTGSTTSEAVTYTTSGDKKASVAITTKNGSGVVQCSPLHVNGAPITGCKCAPAAEKVDVQEGGAASWSVTGCTTTANITEYVWGGAGVTGAETAATATLAAKGDAVTPTLRVLNDDNSYADVTCPTVTAFDSALPDYALGFAGTNIPSAQDTSIAIPFNKEACIQISIDWQNSGWTPPGIALLCDVAPAQNSPGLKLDINYNGTTKSYSGEYNISNSGISLGAIKSGQNTFNDVCVTVTGTEGGSAKCFFGNS